MIFNVKTIAAGIVMSAIAVAAGCSDRGSGPGGPEVVQAGYSVDDGYYNQGSYQGDYWVWRDRNGREQREARADHERRASVRTDHAAVDRGRADVSNDHRDATNNARRDASNNDHRDAVQPNHSQPENTRRDQAQPGHDQAGHAQPGPGRVEPGHESQPHGDAAPAHGDDNGADRR
jgi:hypothetical protein